MGCDIHLHTEIKINGEWHHYGHPSVSRNYALFARMANVRNSRNGDYITPISEPKGMPDDVALITRLDAEYWKPDGHSYSWLNAREIAELAAWAKSHAESQGYTLEYCWESNQFGYLFGNHWSDYTTYGDDRRDYIEDIRFVFWFDN